VKRTGGFAGLEDNKEIDTSNMNEAEARNIEEMIKNIGFFDLPAVMSSDLIGADQYHYQVTVSENNRKHTVSFDRDDGSNTTPLCKLVDILK
jgi:hypothetical protein